MRQVSGCIAEVIEDIKQIEGADAVLMANAWCDGLFVDILGANVAAKCALTMQPCSLVKPQ